MSTAHCGGIWELNDCVVVEFGEASEYFNSSRRKSLWTHRTDILYAQARVLGVNTIRH